MQLSFDVKYPIDSAYGADFFTGASLGEIIEEGPDGPTRRPEQVLITDRMIDDAAWGRVVIGERTVRHLAHALQMVDGWRVARIVEDSAQLRSELTDLSVELALTREQLEFQRQLERTTAEPVYLALDGTHHASERACQEATAKALGVDLQVVIDAAPRPLNPALNSEAVAP